MQGILPTAYLLHSLIVQKWGNYLKMINRVHVDSLFKARGKGVTDRPNIHIEGLDIGIR